MRGIDPTHRPTVVPFEAVRELRAHAQALARELERTRARAAEAEGEAERARNRAAEAEAELEDALNQAAPVPEPSAREARLAADLANVRRHRDEQIAAARREERVARLQALGEVQDSLVRSLEANPEPDSPWYQGNLGILGQVRSALASAGARAIGAPGEPFDPRLHEALGVVPTPEHAPGTVVAVQRSGLQLDDGSLVRPALVVVAA